MKVERVVLHFPKEVADKPVIVNLVRKYDLNFNILKAAITPDEEGIMVLEISGDDEKFSKGLEYLKENGIKIQPLSKDVVWLQEKCTHCGYCVSYCPTGALSKDKNTYVVSFDSQKCTTCGICVEICPFKAMEIRL
ncbi:MAG TPA: 4Fe-4S dicluster domain-containing protein [Thermotogaceae bacterium]|nr:4Fe-4S binding protein [Thermotogota bacterium]HEW91672.1 4Fe-4S dicluster domain-containing protein [Thermotogaceae bacterium]